MDLELLATDLNTYGDVEYCGYNGDNQSMLIISISNFLNTVENINNFNAFIESRVTPEFPYIDHFGLNDGKLKTVYIK